MTIAAICRREIITIDSTASLRDAATLMRERHVGALVVTVETAGHEQVMGPAHGTPGMPQPLALR